MTLTFEAPGFPAPMAITSHATIYTAADAVDIEQRDVRVNGHRLCGRAGAAAAAARARAGRLAAARDLLERCLHLLARRAGGDRRCRRATSCRLRLIDRKRSLFAGTVWIAADTFGMVKVSAVQTALRGPIVSSEQTDEFRIGRGRPVAARAIGDSAALRGAGPSHADPSRAGDRSAGSQPRVVRGTAGAGVRVAAHHAARHARRVPVPEARAHRPRGRGHGRCRIRSRRC